MTTCIAFDPGYDRLGWAVGEVSHGSITKLVAYGAIITNPKETLHERYTQILNELDALMLQYQPQEAALESLFFATNKKTALHVSEARGVLISVLLRQHCLLFEYTPLQVKQAVTGNGRAEKAAVDRMVRMQLALPPTKILDDTMDALGVLLTYATRSHFEKRTA